MNGRTDNPGWLCAPAGVFAQKSSSLNGGIRISSNANTLAWVETPELNLSQPVVLEFESKKWVKEGEGSLYCVIGSDTILSVQNANNTISPRKSIAFYAGENSRIRFTGVKVPANDICIDSIRLTVTDEPTLSLPLIKVVDMGKVKPGAVLNYTQPVSVKNSAGILNFVLPANDNFSISGDTTIVFNDEVSNSAIHFVFNAPVQPGAYMVRVNVDGGEDFAPRTMWLKAQVDPASALENTLEKELKISVQQQKIRISGDRKFQVKLFSISGQLLVSTSGDDSQYDLEAPCKGVFLLRMNSDAGLVARKVIVN
ncbi:MAG: T9SS type A sorting domain-containing protein [Paludibacter sp.]|nr:T9SS type A sorting domain-containing protein [Paludibacter sp.]